MYSGEGGKIEDGKEGREWGLPGLLYADDLVLYVESEEDLKAMVLHFVEVCRKRGLKVIAGKRKLMMLNREEGLEYDVYVDERLLDHVSEFKYF